MRTIYELDHNRIYTGNSRQIGDREGRKRNWIQADASPPEGIAQWRGEWYVLTEYPQPEPTEPDPKLTGIKILNVMCSATSQDQSGLTAVAMGVTLARMNGQVFPDTRFEFANGNTLVITDDNFDLIYSTWTPFRQSFFAVEE
jgi:hypothetical protein